MDDHTDVNESVKMIIKSDIINFKKLYWIEASGPIAHWEEKYGAYKMPAVYAAEILKRYEISIVDEYKYIRKISTSENIESFTKVMYVFPSTDALNYIIKDGEFNKKIENLLEIYNNTFEYTILESLKPKTKIGSIFSTMEWIIDCNQEEHMFYNISIKYWKILYKVLTEIRDFGKTYKFESSDDKFWFYNKLNLCVEILLNANILKLNRYY